MDTENLSIAELIKTFADKAQISASDLRSAQATHDAATRLVEYGKELIERGKFLDERERGLADLKNREAALKKSLDVLSVQEIQKKQYVADIASLKQELAQAREELAQRKEEIEAADAHIQRGQEAARVLAGLASH